MKLVKARVQNFRSAEDSEIFEVNDLTCLVGKNEAGKTAILQALQGINPYGSAQSAFSKTKDYPRRHVTRYDERHDGENAEVVRTWWKLDDHEIEAIKSEFGDAVLDRTLEVIKYYDQAGTSWIVPVDEKKTLANILESSGLNQTERTRLSAHSTGGALASALEALTEPTAKHTEVLTKLKTFRDNSVVLKAIDVLKEYLPKFFYTSHYDRMNGDVSVDNLINDISQNKVVIGDQIFLDFLSLAGTSLEDLRDSSQYEDLKAKCEAASNDVTQQIFEYWTQNDALEVQIDFATAKPSDPPPFNTGTVVHARVWNTLHRASVPFSERSAGFVWFFSFLVQFAAMRDSSEEVIILLDEPGLTLHGKAQADLLRYIEKELLPYHQVIFSTHSPFMVPADRFADVRVVEDVIDRSTSRPSVKGTKVRSDVLATDKDTLFPLQGALGYDLTQSLFVGKNTLLVEGPSDILYLQALSNALKKRRRVGLDPRWTICPSGGLDKVKSFVSLFGGNHLNISVLTDIARGDKKKIEDLRRSQILATDRIYTYADFIGRDEADVEDIFQPTTFINVVNTAYGLTGKNALTVSKLADADKNTTRQVKKVEAFFRTLPTTIPEFDHFTPSAWLIENGSVLEGTDAETETTLNTAEEIFKKFNGLLS